MKRLYLLWVCLLMGSIQVFSQKMVETGYYSGNLDLGGDAVIKKSIKEVEGNKALVSFEVETSQGGEYYAHFWLFPAKLKDGSLAHYEVSVNGNVIAEKIVPTIGDWQDATLPNGKKISLKKGTNTISVIGTAPDVPNVEHIRLSADSEKAKIDDTAYRNYKNALVQESARNAQNTTADSDTIPNDDIQKVLPVGTSGGGYRTDPPLYNYTYLLNVNIRYTYYKTVSFTKDQQIFLATNGIDNFTHILELFSATSPENNSWSAKSNSNCLASLMVTIPATGLYYVRVRSYTNGSSGLCNLNINGVNYYDSIPLFSVGVRCTQGIDQVYNTFTCYETDDPRLWIEEGIFAPGKISAYNDDYDHDGDFDWANNSRIKTQYPRPVHAALLSTYGSYNPTEKCDLYIKCMNSDLPSYRNSANSDSLPFPLLKADDAIQSAPASDVYNCISWSGAITSYWEWPPAYGSTYYSPVPLTAFDNFYGSRGLTRTGATESNAVVALWAFVGANGNRYYTHASVKKGADANAHGYDWESKPGALMRTFHPQYALEGPAYGEIVEYYKKTNATATVPALEKEIAEGTAKIEYVDFSAEENAYISQKVAAINSSVLSQFYQLFSKWKAVTEHTIYSDPEQIANCEAYREVLRFCQSDSLLLYALYEKLGNGGVAVTKLIQDLTFNKNSALPDSTAIVEFLDFNEKEDAYIAQKIATIDGDLLAQFNQLYSKWDAVTKHTIYSDPDKIADCDEYRELLNLCQQNSLLLYLLYERLGNGEFAAVKLIQDLTFVKNSDIMEMVRTANTVTDTGVKIIRPILSNFVAYVKILLAMENEQLAKSKLLGGTTGVSYSNFMDFTISSISGALTVDFTLNSSSKVSLNLLDLSGNVVGCAVNGKVLESGNHSYLLPAEKQKVYLVQLIIDGRVNVKKVTVNP